MIPEQNILFASKIFQWTKADFLDEHTFAIALHLAI